MKLLPFLICIILFIYYKFGHNDKNKLEIYRRRIKKIINSRIYNRLFRNVSLVYKGRNLSKKIEIYHYAYVSFITGEKYKHLINVTIYSIHFFSIYPIILYVSGIISDAMKDIFSLYDRLLVYSIEPERINVYYMKLRVALLSPVLVSQIVESDTIVLPGVDCLFKRIEIEVNEKYPFPMMPRHPDIRGIVKGNGTVNVLDYPMNKRSMRYMHAHMSWKYEALPFIAEVYNKSFIHHYQSDEYGLNVNLWERKANKQWCIYDPFYSVVDISKNNNVFYKYHNTPRFFNFIHGCKSHIIQQKLINKLKKLKYNKYKSIYTINNTINYSKKCIINNLVLTELNKENCLI